MKTIIILGGSGSMIWLQGNVEELSAIGVEFVACRNSLKGSKIEENTLANMIKVVPVGVVELVKSQAQGYGYIKP